MNLKRIFGALLTILGIGGLIYAAVMFAQNTQAIRSLVVFGSLGLGFFIAGISLIHATKDEA